MDTEYLHLLITKYLQQSCSASEKKELEQWLSLSQDNVAYLNQFKKVWENANYNTDNFNPDVENALKKVHAKMNAEPKIIAINRNNAIPTWFKIAASVLLIIGVSAFLYFQFYSMNTSIEMAVISTSKNETKEISLPDGSKVWLNQSSSIEFPKKFETNIRSLKLIGEAFFEIEKNPAKPFIVESNGSYTRVLGTSFNIKALENDTIVTVVLVTGKVKFGLVSDTAQFVLLAPGHEAILKKANNQLITNETVDPNFMAWKTGVFTFSNTSLQDVTNTISPYYHKSFKINVDQNSRITTTFTHQSLDGVLKELELVLNVKCQTNGDTVFISSNQ